MLLLVLFASLLASLRAEENAFEGRTITSIEFQPAAEFLHPDDLAEKMAQLKAGSPLRMSDVRLTIEQLYRSGRFEDIQLDAQDDGAGVALRFDVTPIRFIRNVLLEGLKEPPNRGQLFNATKLALGEGFYDSQVRQSVESLLDTLRANGFYLAKVTPELIEHPHQQIDISFKIDPGERARYSRPIVQGSPNKSVQSIIWSSRWKRWFTLGPWRPVTEARTQQGLDRIRRSYQKRGFLETRVVLDQMEYQEENNRVIPHLTIEAGPLVTVRARGAKISRGKLRELVPIYQELTVDRDLIVEGKREITEHLQSRGYFQAEVDFDQHTEPGGRNVVEYSIFPGPRHKLVYVGMEGNKYFDDETLRERMFTTAATLLRFRRGRFSQDFLRRDSNAIRALYQTNGFRDVEVSTEVESNFRGRENEVGVIFTVREGPQWFVNRLDIEGVDQTTEEDLRSMLTSLEGQPYSELNVASDSEAILGYFFNNGYPDARFEPTATAAEQGTLMNLRYVIAPGERQYVRDVLISGLRTTNPELVKERIRDLAPGDPLAQSSMIESQRRLYDLGVFARVDTAIQNAEGDSEHKYVLYRFEEASRFSITGGIGAQIARIGQGSPSLDTPTGAPGFSPRISLGVSRSNFLGQGHTIGLQTQWANVRRRGLLSYLAPQFKGNDRLNLSFTGLYDDSRDVQTFNSRRREGAVQLSQRFTKANTAQYRVSWRRVTVSDVIITPALIPLFSQPVNLATIAGTFIQDRRDDPIDARRGIYNTIDAAFATNIWADPKTNFTRILGRNATYHRIGREMVFARSISLGIENTLQPFRQDRSTPTGQPQPGDVPLPERFFAGGAASHRGFPDNQAGPRDLLTGFPIGGKALLMNNFELRFPLLGDDVGGVFFHDAGNVYRDISNLSFRWRQRNLADFDYMVHAVGFGIRYRTPIGPVRIDLAYSANSPRFMGLRGTLEQFRDPNLTGVQFIEQRISRFQFHFSLGQLF